MDLAMNLFIGLIAINIGDLKQFQVLNLGGNQLVDKEKVLYLVLLIHRQAVSIWNGWS